MSSSSSSSSTKSSPPSRPASPVVKQYTGEDPEMKYLKRRILKMTPDDFKEAGVNLQLRENIIDLCFPKANNNSIIEDFNDISEKDFDAIRINSWPILKALCIVHDGIDCESPNIAPYIFYKPFSILVDCVDRLKIYLNEFKQRRAEKNENQANLQELSLTKTDDSAFSSASASDSEEPDDIWEALDVEYFIAFVQGVLKVDQEKRCNFRIKKEEEVTFADLPHLFELSETARVAGYFDKSICAFQILGVGGVSARWYLTGKAKTKLFKLIMFCWEFDGLGFCAVRKFVKIKYFEGTKRIRLLPVFPFDYLTNEEKRRLQERESKFLDFAVSQKEDKVVHKYYTGLSLNTIQGSYEYIDGQVIIDHSLAIQNHSSWAPDTDLGDSEDVSSGAPFSCCSCKIGRDRTSGGVTKRWTKIRNGKFFRDQLDRIARICSDPVDEAAKKMAGTCLAPAKVLAFVLRNRKWVQLSIDHVRSLKTEPDGFNSLVLPPNHRDLVKALVKTHFRAQQTTKGGEPHPSGQDSPPELDLVRGKGKGLIMLLHGAPGVGKTSTAECVADYAGRPLFQITCGDIGYEPKEVEKNLEDSFRMAHKWECVLLLDEADVFLARRDRHDLKRNSLVSIFLRILEYYSGILFLTTNRVGTFDEAFKSRIHMSLYYPPLNLPAYCQVWEMNIKRLQRLRPNLIINVDDIMDFASQRYNSLQWNGRQIRNAFQTAFALAEFKAVGEGAIDPVNGKTTLGAEEFMKVADTAAQFDAYLSDIYGGHDDSDRAKTDQLRLDRFNTPTRQPDQHHPAHQYQGTASPRGPPQYGPQEYNPYRDSRHPNPSERMSYGSMHPVPSYPSTSGGRPAHANPFSSEAQEKPVDPRQNTDWRDVPERWRPTAQDFPPSRPQPW